MTSTPFPVPTPPPNLPPDHENTDDLPTEIGGGDSSGGSGGSGGNGNGGGA